MHAHRKGAEETLFSFLLRGQKGKNRASKFRKNMEINELSSKIIGSTIEIHKALGPGLLESAYEEALCHELFIRKLKFERQSKLPVIYKGKALGCGYKMDVVVEGAVVLELKSCEKIEPIHKAQLLTYLKLSGLQLGLILNFNTTVMREGIVRVVNDFKETK